MKDRILQFLSAEKISPAEFADKIGVQRSSMSHILNGRNYPSASFIQKMLQAYPLINSRWLMIGEGKMNLVHEGAISRVPEVTESQNLPGKTEDIEPVKTDLQDAGIQNPGQPSSFEQASAAGTIDRQSSFASANNEVSGQSSGKDETSIKSNKPLANTDAIPPVNEIPAAIPSHEGKEIEQILFFYKDKTFSLYRPS